MLDPLVRPLAPLCAALLLTACTITPTQSGKPQGPTNAGTALALQIIEAQARRASRPNRITAASVRGPQAAATARRMVGRPYRWGGAGPEVFDCSGLVHYAYQRAGARVPRTSAEQFRVARPLALEHVRPGDLVFFRLAQKVSHVGIYLGDGRFVHAPSTGKTVRIDQLDSPYYARHFVRAGRFP